MREVRLSFIFLLNLFKKIRGIPPNPYSPKGFSRYIVPRLFIFRLPDPLNYIVRNLSVLDGLYKTMLYTT